MNFSFLLLAKKNREDKMKRNASKRTDQNLKVCKVNLAALKVAIRRETKEEKERRRRKRKLRTKEGRKRKEAKRG